MVKAKIRKAVKKAVKRKVRAKVKSHMRKIPGKAKKIRVAAYIRSK